MDAKPETTIQNTYICSHTCYTSKHERYACKQYNCIKETTQFYDVKTNNTICTFVDIIDYTDNSIKFTDEIYTVYYNSTNYCFFEQNTYLNQCENNIKILVAGCILLIFVGFLVGIIKLYYYCKSFSQISDNKEILNDSIV
jgi:hypothetical protein